MTAEIDGEAVEVVTTPQAAPEAASSSSDERDFEAEAREQGWKPKDEYGGNPKNWRDAKAFVEFGEIKADIEKSYEERFKRLEKTTSYTVAQLKQQHQRDIDQLKADRRVAVQSGDVDAVEKYDAAIEHKQNNAPGKEPAANDEAAETTFKAANPWYGSDEALTDLAESISLKLAREYKAKHDGQMPYAENLAETEKRVRSHELYKAKFGTKQPAANGHAAVDGGSENGSQPGKSDPLAKLPAEARAQAREDMKRFPKIYPDAVSWIKAYNA